jgi:hypothetical protein
VIVWVKYSSIVNVSFCTNVGEMDDDDGNGIFVGFPFGISFGDRVSVGRRAIGGNVTGWLSFWDVGGAVVMGEMRIGCNITGIPPSFVGLNVIGADVG